MIGGQGVLSINVLGDENWDEEEEVFTHTFKFVLELEHSLVALSKWEAIYKKPFLTDDKRTDDEAIGYIRAMTLTPDTPPEVYTSLSVENMKAIAEYINENQTATWFNNTSGGKGTGQVLTNELIYYWIFNAGIDKECETWHLSRLFTLLQVFGSQNGPQKKMSNQKAALTQAEINRKRREQLESTG